jgi:hypothetical protein
MNDVYQIRKKYVHESVLITLENGSKIEGYIEDYNVPLDYFMIFDGKKHEYLWVPRKIIKEIEVIKDE